MKKLIFLLFSFVFILFSCSTGDDYIEINLPKSGEESELVVTVVPEKSEQLVTKSVGNTDNEKLGQIKNVILGVFFSDGTTNVIRNTDFIYNEGHQVNVKTTLKSGTGMTIYAAANVDKDKFVGIKTVEEFKNVLIELNQSVEPLSGFKNDITIEPKSIKAENTYTLDLYRIIFKVSIPQNSIYVGLSEGGYPNSTLFIDKIFLHNVNTKSTLDYIGSITKSGNSGQNPELINILPNGYDKTRQYFYGFEGQGTKLVISGIFKDNGLEERVYYTINIPAKHNTHYECRVSIFGKGSSNPDTPYSGSGVLNATLVVKAWDQKNITEEFN